MYSILLLYTWSIAFYVWGIFLCEHYVCLPNCTPYNKFLSNNNNNNKKHPTSLWGLFFFIMPTFWRNDIFTIFPARNNLFIITSTFFFSKSIQSFVVFSKIKRKRAHGISLKSLSLLDPKLTLRGHLLQRFLTQLPEDAQAYTNMHVSTDVTTPLGSQS